MHEWRMHESMHKTGGLQESAAVSQKEYCAYRFLSERSEEGEKVGFFVNARIFVQAVG